MLRDVKLIGEERSYPSKLHDALSSVHDCNLILAHKLYATLSSDEFNFAHTKKQGLSRIPAFLLFLNYMM